jgi:dienelactone hydrolase
VVPHVSSEPDVLLFLGATAILALHAAVDSFVAPEPGTSPRDHLLRGVTSLALLALLAVVYPRLRTGGRAALAVVVGGLALEAAALALEDARAVGTRGEDWTGFLLLPVGLVLLGLAAVLIWRSRKPGRLRWLRRATILIGSLLAAYWLVLPVAIAILATHRPRADVRPAALGAPYKQVTLTTRDGLNLAAWYVRSRNGAAVISYPTRSGKVPQARMLVRHGYGVLLLDARGYDGSQGDPNVFGWDDAKDIDAAVAWLRHQPDVRGGRIGGIGFSVGGEMMLQAAASNTRLRAVVSEGAGFRSVREDAQRGPRGWFILPEAAVQTAAIAAMSGTTPPPPLKDLVPKIAPRPVFFIYAGHGAGGEEFNPDLYQAAGAPKALWKIPEANHVGGFQVRPHEYELRVVGFFNRALHPAITRAERQRQKAAMDPDADVA